MFFKNVKIITFKGDIKKLDWRTVLSTGSQTPYTKMESYSNSGYNVQRNEPTVPPPSYDTTVDTPSTNKQTGKFFVSKDFN